MSNIQKDADLCIIAYNNQYTKLYSEIQAHGLPIRMYKGQHTTLWRFNDGHEFEIPDHIR